MDKLILEEIRGKVDLRDLALQTLKGRQTGQRVMAVCPWHPDTDPSLSITQQAYYCFGCHKGGDVFSWFQQQGSSFLESVEKAAAIAGVQIDDEFNQRMQAAAKDRQRLAEFVDQSQAVLWETPAALKYLRERGLTDETVLEFRLGYDKEKRSVVIPMIDLRGDVLAYSLRDPKKTGPGKYWHHNTASFKYGNHLYNETALWLHADDVHVVEGPFDVMKLHQAGFPRSVGIFSGLLNETQIKRLAEKCERIVLLPDTGGEGDWKKLQQNVRALRIAAPELNLMVAVPPEKDAGDCNEEQLQAAVAAKSPPEIVLLDLVVRGDAAEQYERARAYVQDIADPLLRSDVLKQLSERWQKPMSLVEQSLLPVEVKSAAAAFTMSDAVEALRERTLTIASSKLKFFAPGLELFTQTIQPGHTVDFFGHTNVGKSITILNCMRQMLHGDFLHVLFSLEQPKSEVAYRMMVMEAWANGIPTDHRKMRHTILEGGEDYRYLKGLTDERCRNLRIVDTRVSVPEMAATLQTIAAMSNIPLGVVWVDYFGLVKSKGSNKYEQVSNIAVELQDLAKTMGVIVCSAVQLGRSGKGQSRKPDIDSARDSGVIEEVADLVIGLHAEKPDDSGLRLDISAEVLKNRHGPLGGTTWLFQKDKLLIGEKVRDVFD